MVATGREVTPLHWDVLNNPMHPEVRRDFKPEMDVDIRTFLGVWVDSVSPVWISLQSESCGHTLIWITVKLEARYMRLCV